MYRHRHSYLKHFGYDQRYCRTCVREMDVQMMKIARPHPLADDQCFGKIEKSIGQALKVFGPESQCEEKAARISARRTYKGSAMRTQGAGYSFAFDIEGPCHLRPLVRRHFVRPAR